MSKSSSNISSTIVTKLKDNTTNFGGLHLLELSSTNIGSKDLTFLADLIKANGTTSETLPMSPLISVDLSNNPLCGVNSRGRGDYETDGLNDLLNCWISLANKNSCRLRKLSLARSLIYPRGFTLLGNFLTIGPSSIQELNLRQCGGNHEAIEKLCEGLKQNRTLTKLDISENDIGPVGAAYIADMLTSTSGTSRLKELWMNGCSIDSEGAQSIFQSMQNNMCIEIFAFAANHFRDNACEAVANMLVKNTRLRHLDISENGIGISGCTAICRGLARNKSLIFIGIQWNDLTNDCARRIGEAIVTNTSLRAIHVLGNHINLEGIKAIVDSSLINGERPIELDLGFCYRPPGKSRQGRERKVLKDGSSQEGLDGIDPPATVV